MLAPKIHKVGRKRIRVLVQELGKNGKSDLSKRGKNFMLWDEDYDEVVENLETYLIKVYGSDKQ